MIWTVKEVPARKALGTLGTRLRVAHLFRVFWVLPCPRRPCAQGGPLEMWKLHHGSVRICMYAWMDGCMCVYIYVCVCAQTHTHTYIHMMIFWHILIYININMMILCPYLWKTCFCELVSWSLREKTLEPCHPNISKQRKRLSGLRWDSQNYPAR